MKNSKATELQINNYLRKQEPECSNICVDKETNYSRGKTRTTYRAYAAGVEKIGARGWTREFTTTNKLLTFLKSKYEKKN